MLTDADWDNMKVEEKRIWLRTELAAQQNQIWALCDSVEQLIRHRRTFMKDTLSGLLERVHKLEKMLGI